MKPWPKVIRRLHSDPSLDSPTDKFRWLCRQVSVSRSVSSRYAKITQESWLWQHMPFIAETGVWWFCEGMHCDDWLFSRNPGKQDSCRHIRVYESNVSSLAAHDCFLLTSFCWFNELPLLNDHISWSDTLPSRKVEDCVNSWTSDRSIPLQTPQW